MTRSTLLASMLLLTACDSAIVDRGEPGPVGARGPAGPPGPQGRAGRDVATLAPSTYVVRGSEAVPASRTVDATIAQAFCDEGDLVLNGGCEWGDWRGDHFAEVRAYLTGPIGQDGGPDGFRGWQCHGIGMGEETAIYVVAMCLENPGP